VGVDRWWGGGETSSFRGSWSPPRGEGSGGGGDGMGGWRLGIRWGGGRLPGGGGLRLIQGVLESSSNVVQQLL